MAQNDHGSSVDTLSGSRGSGYLQTTRWLIVVHAALISLFAAAFYLSSMFESLTVVFFAVAASLAILAFAALVVAGLGVVIAGRRA